MNLNPRIALLNWAEGVMDSRSPDVTLKNREGGIYLERWYIWPLWARSPGGEYKPLTGNWFGLYIHRFLGSDEDRALHDHPRHNASLVLSGGYLEHLRDRKVWREPGSWVFRHAATAHRVVLPVHIIDQKPYPLPAVSLFFTGPKVRDWGFHCPGGWVPWQQFTKSGPDGKSVGCP